MANWGEIEIDLFYRLIASLCVLRFCDCLWKCEWDLYKATAQAMELEKYHPEFINDNQDRISAIRNEIKYLSQSIRIVSILSENEEDDHEVYEYLIETFGRLSALQDAIENLNEEAAEFALIKNDGQQADLGAEGASFFLIIIREFTGN